MKVSVFLPFLAMCHDFFKQIDKLIVLLLSRLNFHARLKISDLL